MLNSYNSKQALPLRGIAARATLSGFSENSAYVPDKKATKFIVTLKPVQKSNDNAISGSMINTCRCEGKIKHDRGKLQVRTDDALHGKTILNAFRLLANSKFISIDPNYGTTTESLTVGQTINQLRLTGGSENTPCTLNKPKKKYSFVPTCVRPKKKSRKFEVSNALFETTDKKEEEKSSENSKQQLDEDNVLTSNDMSPQIVSVVPSVESSLYKVCDTTTVNEICKPRSFKDYSELTTSTIGVNRIGKLEDQVDEMRQELSQIRKEFIPQTDVQRYAELENRLKELNLILCDLKNNCVKATVSNEVQNEQLQSVQYINPPSTIVSETGTQTMRERHVEESVLPTPRDNNYARKQQQQEEKICICDDCECKESGDCLLNHKIEPNVILIDEPKPPRPRRVLSSPLVIAEPDECPEPEHVPWQLKRRGNDECENYSNQSVRRRASPPATRRPQRQASPRRQQEPSRQQEPRRQLEPKIIVPVTASSPRHSDDDENDSVTNRGRWTSPPTPQHNKTVESYTEMTDSSRKTSPTRQKEETRDSYTQISQESSENLMECWGVCGDAKCGVPPSKKHGPDPESTKSKDYDQKHMQKHVRDEKEDVVSDDEEWRQSLEEERIKKRISEKRLKEDEEEKRRKDEEEWRQSIEEETLKTRIIEKRSKESQAEDEDSYELEEGKCPPREQESDEIQQFSSYCLYCDDKEVPIITEKLLDEILNLVRGHAFHDIALTILLQSNDLYHINVSEMSSGLNIGCLYATEEGIKSGNKDNLFEEFLTFFIVDSRNTSDQKNKILHHTFEFIREGGR